MHVRIVTERMQVGLEILSVLQKGRRARLVVEHIKLNLHLSSSVYLESLLHVVTFTLNTPIPLSDVLILYNPIPAILLI